MDVLDTERGYDSATTTRFRCKKDVYNSSSETHLRTMALYSERKKVD